MSAVVRCLNTPLIKEEVKNIASVTAFSFGIIEAVDIYQILRGRGISTETGSDQPKWIQIASKVAIVCAKISLILAAGTSRPGVFLIATLMGWIFSTGQLERLFGPNAVFAVNPWHPRHVFSIAAVLLALPSVVQSAYEGLHWNQSEKEGSWLSDQKVRWMALFNTIVSRPVQHIGNQLCRG